MQKDMHYYMTGYLCFKAGVPADQAQEIAWASQRVDEQTDRNFGLHGFQTQCALMPQGNWKDRTIQRHILGAFHFIPRDQQLPEGNPWVVTANSANSRELLRCARISGNPMQLGIALHAYMDTWSHQGFTALCHKHNSCFAWDNLVATIIPSIGHADMVRTPDIADAVWVDPRDNAKTWIENYGRFMEACRWSFLSLQEWAGTHEPERDDWGFMSSEVSHILTRSGYEQRKQAILGGLPKDFLPRYSDLHTMFWSGNKKKKQSEFNRAAQGHLAVALSMLPIGKGE